MPNIEFKHLRILKLPFECYGFSRGYLPQEAAFDIVSKIFRDNAIELYDLGL